MFNRIKFFFLLIAFECISLQGFTQQLEYVKKTISTLCSKDFAGRGYVRDGDKKAANFIREELKNAKVKSFGADYFQSFGFEVNTFPGVVSIVVDGHGLVPGDDYIVEDGSPSINGSFDLVWLDSATVDDPVAFKKFKKQGLRNVFIVLDQLRGVKFINAQHFEEITTNKIKSRGLIYHGEQKLTHSVSPKINPFPVIYMKKGVLKRHQTFALITIEGYLKAHGTQNVIGYIEGSKYKDSFIVFTAHYDHLGMMGQEAVFPGANDNASGVAMLLDMANYYSKNKPEYSIAFIFFAAEEIGLFGSYYYTQNPVFPLAKISLLLNLDLMGTGDKGMTAVNATVFPNEFQLLQMINNDSNYLPVVASRGKAANSDHHFFTERGIKSFFFYLMGDYHYYHDIDDRAEVLTLSKYNEAFKLITSFVQVYSKGVQ